MGLTRDLRLAPNRRRQFELYGLADALILASVILAIALGFGWLEANTRLAKAHMYTMVVLGPVLIYRMVEQLVRPVIRIDVSGISWWTIDRKSGRIPVDQIEEIAVEDLERDQAFVVRRKNGTEVRVPIQPIDRPDQFIVKAYARLGTTVPEGPGDLHEDAGS